MHSHRSIRRALLVFAAAGVLVGLFVVIAPFAFGADRASSASITVTAGKPTEYAFILSKKVVAPGKVVFMVVNGGRVSHNFTIAGKKTRLLAPGKWTYLTVVFRKTGSYAFSSSVKGQAARGMKGVFNVSAKPATVPAAGVKPTYQPTAVPGVGPPCTNPANTTVSVRIVEYSFVLSPATVPCGSVTFNVSNSGLLAHNFDIEAPTAAGIAAPVGGRILNPDETTTVTLNYSRTGTYRFQCNTHWQDYAMGGSLRVT